MIDAVNRRARSLNGRTILLSLVALPFYLVGWLAGVCVRAVLWMVAAVLAGYEAGRGE